MFRNKILFVLFLFLVISLLFIYFAVQQAKGLSRDTPTLLNQYYFLRQTDKEAAKRALLIILKQDKQQIIALQELSQIYLEEDDDKNALPLLETLQKLKPQTLQYPFHIATIYYKLGEWDKAQTYYLRLVKQDKDDIIRQKAFKMLEKMASFVPNYRVYSVIQYKNAPVSASVPAQDASIVSQILMSWFYQLKMEGNQYAFNVLSMVHLLDLTNPAVNDELGYFLLAHKKKEEALAFFLLAYDVQPSAQRALQIAYLYMDKQANEKASDYFLIAAQSPEQDLHVAALKGLTIAQGATQGKTLAFKNQFDHAAGGSNKELQRLDQFYSLKKQNPRLAWQFIQGFLRDYPSNVLALKEAGYLSVKLNQYPHAIEYFTRAYVLTYDPEVAMQLGYLYDRGPNKYLAYQYFKQATRSNDNTLALHAQNALTNLAGLQTKVLPPPYFGEIFFSPFTQSRFGLTVRPFIARFGYEADNRFHTKTYAVFRQTDDNRSDTLGEIPQIYEDNVRIIGGGVSLSPLQQIPLVAWVEAGGAYDLIFRNRDHWRGDLRGGLMYYDEKGKKPAYFDTLRVSPDYYSLYYGDVTYFSRFDNNVIGTLKTHQGIRLVQYKSSMINLYLSGRVIEDTRREFFNNIAEIGPGIGIIPSNRFRLELRLEYIKGTYLPAGGSVNPYGKHYNNALAQLLFYVKV